MSRPRKPSLKMANRTSADAMELQNNERYRSSLVGGGKLKEHEG